MLNGVEGEFVKAYLERLAIRRESDPCCHYNQMP